MFYYSPFLNTEQREKEEKSIRQFIKKNKISCLTHFTHIDNLKSILQFGILPASVLRGNRIFSSVRFTDEPLPHTWAGLVSLNVSFPDYKLFTRLQKHEPSDWVVLLINIQAITDFPCYFFPNQAVNYIQNAPANGINLSGFQSAKDFKNLFADQGEIKRKDLNIPQFYPTSPFSEVLSFFPIAPSYITQVHFYSDYKFNQWVLSNTEFAISQDRNRWVCGLQYFSPREDYTYWKTQRNIWE